MSDEMNQMTPMRRHVLWDATLNVARTLLAQLEEVSSPTLGDPPGAIR